MSWPLSEPYTPFDIGATVYRVLGVEPDAEIRDSQDRPTRLNDGTPVDVLFRNA